MHSLWRCTPFSRDDHLTGHHLKRGGYNVHSPLRCTPHPLMITPPCDHHSHSLYMYISPRSLCIRMAALIRMHICMPNLRMHAHGLRMVCARRRGRATVGAAPLVEAPRCQGAAPFPFNHFLPSDLSNDHQQCDPRPNPSNNLTL